MNKFHVHERKSDTVHLYNKYMALPINSYAYFYKMGTKNTYGYVQKSVKPVVKLYHLFYIQRLYINYSIY